MVVGGPGSGKTTLALALGRRTGLPVRHMDHVHWQPGWVERDRSEKDRLTRAIHAEPAWIFEGGHSRTYDERAARADTLIWLDLPMGLRIWRVLRRTVRDYGRSRADLPPGCPEKFDPRFLLFIVSSRQRSRQKIAALIAAHPHLDVRHLRKAADVRAFLATVPGPAA
jgi:adenylate kinase family enzyme